MSMLTPAKTIPVARPSIGVEEEKAVLEVLRSGWLARARELRSSRSALRNMSGRPTRLRCPPAQLLCIWRWYQQVSDPAMKYCVLACLS